MIGDGDAALFLGEDFAEDVRLSNNTTIKGIYDIDDDLQFGGLAEGRMPSLLISTQDFEDSRSALRHGQTLTIAGTNYEVETSGPHGADREFTKITLRFV